MSMGGHHSHRMGTDEWLTPPEILAALGPFDLDPCAPVARPWPMAAQHYTILDDGLMRAWEGRVWLNPPYGSEAERWLNRLATHGNGIALIFARTETEAFFSQVWERADALLFIRGRLTFCHVDGTRAKTNGGGSFGSHRLWLGEREAPGVFGNRGEVHRTRGQRMTRSQQLARRSAAAKKARRVLKNLKKERAARKENVSRDTSNSPDGKGPV